MAEKIDMNGFESSTFRKTLESEFPIIYSDHILAYVDILGQSAVLNKMCYMPRHGQQDLEFNENIAHTYGAIKFFRESLMDNISNDINLLKLAPEEFRLHQKI